MESVTPRITYQAHLEHLAKVWDQRGRHSGLLLPDNWKRMVAVYWRHNHEKLVLPTIVDEFIQENEKFVNKEEWKLIDYSKNYCTTCRDRYQFENLSICVWCSRLYCYRCAEDCGYCGGELAG